MALTRKVNGQTVEIPAQEEAAIRAEWQAAEAARLSAWRASATITRAAFLRACISANIITAEVAKDAASGAWPTAFNAFLSGLTDDQVIEAKAAWADAKNVRRNSEVLALIAAYQGVSDATLDAMFGWT